MNAAAPDATTTAVPPRAQRHDGWTPERQRAFLEAVADGHSAETAARSVGLSPASAYALRRRAAGAAFALGWDAARLLARETVADALTARAVDGQEERITRADGSEVIRFRYDNRLATAMLTRLDRQADALNGAGGDAGRAARMAAGDFDQYLDIVSAGAGPARAALFLRARDGEGEGDPATRPAPTPAPASTAPDTVPRPAWPGLARADHFLRWGVGLPQELDVADLDPDGRDGWTAEQWARAEAAGLLRFAPAAGPAADPAAHRPDDEPDPQLPQLSRDPYVEPDPGARIWWDQGAEEWRTDFPPPPDTDPVEYAEWGDVTYERELTLEEGLVADQLADAAEDAGREADEAERDAWFATVRDALAALEEQEGADPDAAPAPPAWVEPAATGLPSASAPNDTEAPPDRVPGPGGTDLHVPPVPPRLFDEPVPHECPASPPLPTKAVAAPAPA